MSLSNLRASTFRQCAWSLHREGISSSLLPFSGWAGSSSTSGCPPPLYSSCGAVLLPLSISPAFYWRDICTHTHRYLVILCMVKLVKREIIHHWVYTDILGSTSKTVQWIYYITEFINLWMHMWMLFRVFAISLWPKGSYIRMKRGQRNYIR